MLRNLVPNPNRGEVWLVDLGYAAKIRPCLVVSIAPAISDRALITLVPHTTSVRGSQFEVAIPKGFLKAGAFDVQGLITTSESRFVRRLGNLSSTDVGKVEEVLKRWLGL